ncbi:hypothetical protein BFP70_11080 [Thioclava sp. SK-1]|uniref:HWE histidine kinase domain-containing protein n=1 Tax=Thioclava sp. SK-1 TaxID=1889770 RepID=UPI0008247C25|nr:HWE histidine kinase domain-containing protein [Thioclava sp. SK-1]OCX64568.1 hypothetical protein BFP70_11080 [Thioclava sp. SK-1]
MTHTPDSQPPVQPHTVDLTSCDREPIHLLGRVQRWGCLIALTSDWIVRHQSINCSKVLGPQVADVVGHPLHEFLPFETLKKIRAQLAFLDENRKIVRLFGVDFLEDGRLFDMSAHQNGTGFVLELEPKTGPGQRDDLAQVQPIIAKLSSSSSVAQMAQLACEGLQSMTGFGRVMAYQFTTDGSGTVIAESLSAQMQGYLGMHFPASDIPRQARALYTKTLLRHIADVDDPGVPILPAHDPMGNPLDLSLSVSRSVSPIHLEYLRNMGVKSSMSVSILRKGQLWGLLACHHPEPMLLDYEKRTSVELLAQLLSYELARAENEIEAENASRAQNAHNRIMSLISGDSSWESNFDDVAESIARLIKCDGIALYSDGTYLTQGSTPSAEEFPALARFLNGASQSQVYATDCITSVYPAGETFTDRSCGLLALPISRRPRDYLVLFRHEIARSVTWAGNPNKSIEYGPNGSRLTPRKSFETWREVVKGCSAPWTAGELRAAESLRVTLLEIVLKLTDMAAQERNRAQEQQEILISELNHRVRNILNLIRSLMKQSQSGAQSIESFTQALDGRINALSRAHDQLTKDQYSPIPLSELIAVELGAFSSKDMDRIVFAGQDAVIAPKAFTPMALVFHELVTNSVKYGALHVPQGRVEVTMSQAEDGIVSIDWIERGGPVVNAPTRRGFGSTIIERTIPHELGGGADVRYATGGLEARFEVPPNVIVETRPFAKQNTDTEMPSITPDVDQPGHRLNGAALIVEDTMIVALDLAGMLEDLGATDVQTAPSVAQALRLLEDGFNPMFAVLDVNLGNETSLAVAEYLAKANVPFLLASGYDRDEAGIDAYPPAYLVRKPYTAVDLQDALVAIDVLKG